MISAKISRLSRMWPWTAEIGAAIDDVDPSTLHRGQTVPTGIPLQNWQVLNGPLGTAPATGQHDHLRLSVENTLPTNTTGSFSLVSEGFHASSEFD
jgi:hypothetical protein